MKWLPPHVRIAYFDELAEVLRRDPTVTMPLEVSDELHEYYQDRVNSLVWGLLKEVEEPEPPE